MSRRRAASVASRCIPLVLGALAGCTGRAELQFVSTNLASINPPPPIVYRYDPQQCYWWLDDDGSMNFAMQFDNVSLLSEIGRLRLQLSLTLDGPPAGEGRDYQIGSRNVRGRFDTALAKARLISAGGVVSITKAGDGRFRGSFRILLQQFPGISLFTLAPQRPGNYLMFGTFDAVNDAAHGRAIRADTEADGWIRTPAAAAPTTSPAQ